MRLRLTAPALLVVLVLGLAACGGAGDNAPDGGDAATSAPAGAATEAGEDGAASGDAPTDADLAADGGAPPVTWAFTAQTLDGQEFDAAALAGKPAVLWFWAPWCPTCRAQSSTVAEVAGRHAGEVNVVGVAGLDDSVEAMRDFVTETGTGSFTHLADPAGEVWQRFEMTQQSTYVLVDAAGTVIHSGFLNNEELVAQVARLAA